MLSVVICTYNRSEVLSVCLETIAAYYPKNYTVEVIVVNNNSSDDTEHIVQQVQKNNPWVQLVNESKQGLSHARNLGFQTATQSWILYLDDDAKIDKNLFNRVHHLITSSEYRCIGGLYLPWYAVEKPRWFRDKWASNKMQYHELSTLKRTEYACGGIMLIQKFLLEEHDGFNSDFGMKGNHLHYGEETDLQQRIRKTGEKIAYDPFLIIYHRVSPHKMNVKWLLGSSYTMGQTFLLSTGYPNNMFTGFVGLFIALFQSLIHLLIYLPLLLKKGYFIENYIVDVFKKPAKWLGVFTGSWRGKGYTHLSD